MHKATIGGVALEYEVRGQGEPVVLIHGSHIADAFAPLLEQPALTARYRLILYHRRGFAGSTHPDGPLDIRQQAADCHALMQRLDVPRAHVVGHSYGGAIALQLAADSPGAVQSLGLFEPALFMVPGGPMFMQAMAPLVETWAAGNKAAAVDGFLQAVVGPGCRTLLDQALPGAFEQAQADADTFFTVELPALQRWDFGADNAAGIDRPVLFVRGADSPSLWPGWLEVQQLVQDWFPRTEIFVLDNATHALQIVEPAAVANRLAAFFAQHPFQARQAG
jgi:pimeloyl-ACP methyl ester carboxylesterase